MSVVLTICGVLALLYLLVNLPNGGWKTILPMLVWLAVTFAIAAALPKTGERVAALVVALGGAVALRELADRRTAQTDGR